MTLLEMVVVLGIMAVLAAVAVKSLEPMADQSRYDATQRTLTNIEEAILGSEELRQPDGTPLITGFVADIGRVPVLRGTSAASQLAELWDESWWTSFPFALRQGPGGYSSIRLPCGFRGPYLNLGLGASDLRDGWGEAFQLQPATEGSSLQTVTWNAVTPYTDDLVLDAAQGLVPVSGTVTNDGAVPGSSTVVLLYPNPSSSTTYLTVMSDGDSDQRTFTFANVPIGLRAIHATIDGNTVNKYVYVPRGGLSLTINYVP